MLPWLDAGTMWSTLMRAASSSEPADRSCEDITFAVGTAPSLPAAPAASPHPEHAATDRRPRACEPDRTLVNLEIP